MKHVLTLEVFTTDPLQHLSSKVQEALEKVGLTDIKLRCAHGALADGSASPHAPAAGESTIHIRESTIHIGELTINPHARTVKLGRRLIGLTPKEFDLLCILASRPGKTFSRQELLERVWGFALEQYEHTITSHINRLRFKLEPNEKEPVYILTTWGAGYRLAE